MNFFMIFPRRRGSRAALDFRPWFAEMSLRPRVYSVDSVHRVSKTCRLFLMSVAPNKRLSFIESSFPALPEEGQVSKHMFLPRLAPSKGVKRMVSVPLPPILVPMISDRQQTTSSCLSPLRS